MNKPIIYCPRARLSHLGVERHFCNAAYERAIREAGGILVTVNSVSEEDWDDILEVADGILLQGGWDVHPHNYDANLVPQPREYDADRDKIEIYVAQKALEQKRPLLGICRGLQVMNVALGGTLIQDLSGDQDHHHKAYKGERSRRVHGVNIKEETHLASILNKKNIEVNSMHHQAVDKLGKGLVVSATSPDNVVEAIEYPDHFFFHGYQWHVEELKDDNSSIIFETFIDSCFITQ